MTATTFDSYFAESLVTWYRKRDADAERRANLSRNGGLYMTGSLRTVGSPSRWRIAVFGPRGEHEGYLTRARDDCGRALFITADEWKARLQREREEWA